MTSAPRAVSTDANSKTTAARIVPPGQTDKGSEPRLPHEHDESSDSQNAASADHLKQGKQAHDDVTRGLVDTDLGPVTDKVYNEKVKK